MFWVPKTNPVIQLMHTFWFKQVEQPTGQATQFVVPLRKKPSQQPLHLRMSSWSQIPQVGRHSAHLLVSFTTRNPSLHREHSVDDEQARQFWTVQGEQSPVAFMKFPERQETQVVAFLQEKQLWSQITHWL